MNLKALKGTAAGLGIMGLVGCGQGYSPSPADHDSSPRGGDVFNSHDDSTVYRTASYEVLRYTLTDVLALGGAAATNLNCEGNAVAACPRSAPVQYLDANRSSLGVPNYQTENPDETQVPGTISSGGFKVWALAASSACGRMMGEQQPPALFPNGDVSDYEYMYNVLLARSPTAEEAARLDALRADFSSDEMQGAAVCYAVLGSLEFLTVN